MCGFRSNPLANRIYSLKDAAEFRAAMRNGRPVKAGPIRVFVNANGLDYPRLGSTLSRKQIPRAVDRNRAKRLLRESVRHHRNALKGMDIVFTAVNAINDKSNAEIRTLLEHVWAEVISHGGAYADAGASCHAGRNRDG